MPALISWSSLDNLKFLSEIALALIMFAIGGQFRSEYLRRWGRQLFTLSCFEIGITFLFVFLTFFVANFFLLHSFVDPKTGLFLSSLQMAIFVAAIAIATAPAATLLVIREYESNGPVTEIVLALVGLNNFISIFIFNIFSFIVIQNDSSFGGFLFTSLGPIAIGIFIGFIISIWAQEIETPNEIQLLLLGGIIGYTGISHILHIDTFLGCFFMGVTISNASPKVVSLFSSLRKIEYPIYVLFFIIAGASLHIDTIPHLGYLGILYIFMRLAGKFIGTWIGARVGKFGEIERKWIGYTLLAQAGVAIGLSQTLARTWPEGGEIIQTIVLGSVVIFELIGPIAVRHGLVKAGEVPILNLLAKRAPENSYEGLHHVLEHFRSSVGIPIGHKLNSPADIQVRHVMRKNVETILETTPFNELLRRISHSKYDRFPVVNSNKQFIGLIDYQDIREILFDDTLASLVVAKDLLKHEAIALYPNQTLGDVLAIFQIHTNISYLPVVDSDEAEKLLGIISQNDVLAAFRSHKIPKMNNKFRNNK